jgi:competence protein ComEC
MSQHSSSPYRLPTPYLPIYGALALGAGVAAGSWLQARGVVTCAGEILTPNPSWLLLPLIVLVPLLWPGRHQKRALIPLVAVIFLLLGGWRYLSHPFQPCFGPGALASHHAEDRFGRPRVMEGVIVSYPVQREKYTQYQVRVDVLWQGERKLPVTGMALVRSDAGEFFYGDRVRIRGGPESPPTFPDFDYRRYLAGKGIHTLVRRADLHLMETGQGNPVIAALYQVRARASALLDQLMPQPYAALANGMILGIESGIPRELYAKFNLTGTSHVIVISGSNIALVSGILLLLFTWMLRGRKKLAALLAAIGIGLYTLLVGADPAVVRAAIMGGIFVLGIAFGRQSSAIVSLFVAGILMLLLNPLILWDVGFQLSFMATLGLILFSTPLQRWWDASVGKRLPRLANNLIAEALLITLAAQITTMPMVVYYFGRLSVISFLANLLIIPVQPPIMIAGGLAILLAAIFFPLGQLIAFIPLASLWWTVFVVERLAAIPWGSIEVGAFGRMLAALFYVGFGAGFLWWLLRQEQHARHLIPPALKPALLRTMLATGVIIAVVWTGAATLEARPDGRLHIRLLGLEDNAAWLITMPGGNRALAWDGRESAIPLPDVLETLPRGGQPLDLLIDVSDGRAEPDLLPGIAALKVLPGDLGAGTVVQLDADVALTRLPTPADEAPLYRLQYGDFSLLLPLTNSQQAQADLLASGVLTPVTLLVTPWPGTGAWPHPDLLAVLRPQVILQPAGVTYPPSVLAGLDSHPARALIPNDGMTEIITDGRSLTLLQQAYSADISQR